MSFLFEKSWNQASKAIQQYPHLASDLFYDWFCSNKSLQSRATKLLPKINFVFDKLQLDTSKFKVTLKNNCPVRGSLYDSFMLDSIDGKHRIYISPKLGFEAKDLMNKCEITVISYGNESVVSEKLNKVFDNWQTFKNHINNGKIKDEILEALHE